MIKKTEQFIVEGTLNFDTVTDLKEEGCDYISEVKISIFDLRSAKVEDNSALALLIAWFRVAKNLKKTIYFINLPDKLFNLIKLGGLEEILPIK